MTRRLLPAFLALACATGPGFAQSENGPEPNGPATLPGRQIWVPKAELESVLDRFPEAVFVSPHDFESLLSKAASAAGPATPSPPEPVRVRSLQFTAALDTGMVRVQGRLEMENLTDAPAHLAISLPERLATLDLSEKAALRRQAAPPGNGAPTGSLQVEGSGLHQVSFGFDVAVRPEARGYTMRIPHPHVPGATFRLNHTDDVAFRANAGRLTQEDPRSTTFVFPASGGPLNIHWQAPGAPPAPVLRQSAAYDVQLRPGQLSVTSALAISSRIGDLPGELSFPLPPSAKILDARGAGVARWSVEPDGLRIQLKPGRRTQTALTLRMAAPIPESPRAARTELPLLREARAHRVEGTLELRTSPGLSARLPDRPGALEPLAPEFDPGASPLSPSEPLRFAFVRLPEEALEVEFRSKVPVLRGTSDLAVRLAPDHAVLTRTVQLFVSEAPLFETVLSLPKGEVVTLLRPEETPGLRWQLEGNSALLAWDRGLTPGTPCRLQIRSRIDLAPSAGPLELRSLEGNAESWEGWVALQTGPENHARLIDSTGLRAADAATSPVQGDLAWRWNDRFQASFDLRRTETAFDAAIISAVQPNPSAPRLSGELILTASGVLPHRFTLKASGIALHGLRLRSGPASIAEYLAGGAVVLQIDEPGRNVTRVAWSVDLPASSSWTMPVLSVTEALQTDQLWIVDAAPELEVDLKHEGLDEVLTGEIPAAATGFLEHAPLAAFRPTGDRPPSLRLETHVHPVHPGFDGLAIREINLLSAIGHGEQDRHTLRLSLAPSSLPERLHVDLPKGAEVDYARLNGSDLPANRTGDALRLTLPPASEGILELAYETPAEPWLPYGSRQFEPPRLDAHSRIPQASWTLYLPEGYSFSGFKGNLTPAFHTDPPILLVEAADRLAPHLNRLRTRWLPGSGLWMQRFPWLQRVADALPSPPTPSMPLADEPPAVFPGQALRFEAPASPGTLQVSYESWSRQLRHAWLGVVGGLLAFWILARDRVFFVGLFGVALLTFLPSSGLTDLRQLANALLTGWLLAMALRLCWFVTAWIEEKLRGPRGLPLEMP